MAARGRGPEPARRGGEAQRARASSGSAGAGGRAAASRNRSTFRSRARRAQGLARSTALHFASQKGDVGTIEILLRCGACPRARDQRGRTALHLATQEGHSAAIQALARGGCAVNAQTPVGGSASTLCHTTPHDEALHIPQHCKRNSLVFCVSGKWGAVCLCARAPPSRLRCPLLLLGSGASQLSTTQRTSGTIPPLKSC